MLWRQKNIAVEERQKFAVETDCNLNTKKSTSIYERDRNYCDEDRMVVCLNLDQRSELLPWLFTMISVTRW